MRNFHFQVRGTRDHILEIMKYDVVNKIWPMTSNEEIKKKNKKRWVSAMGNDPWIQENSWALDSVCFLHSIIPYTSIRSSHGNEKKKIR